MSSNLFIIGGGLAGCEAAWQAAERGISVKLFEMRPGLSTGAHATADLAELVCSNSLGSNLIDRASGLLKEELRILGSLLIKCADQTAVPAGGALAVDRVEFSKLVTQKIISHPRIEVIREEVREIPEVPTIIASGPLTSNGLSQSIANMSGNEHLYFFDAIAPIVTLESINMDIAFRGSRYGRGTQEQGDYINCPFQEAEYDAFVNALSDAERIELKEFDRLHEVEGGVNAGDHRYFEGCLPVEVLARRDMRALAFGPLRPVGLQDPHTGYRPFAVVQLRQDNLAGTLYNLVGFQTNLKFPEQRRVFRMIPGLENAEFVRYGQMHRNTFIYSPGLLLPSMQYKFRTDLFFAGQITGIEGYAGNIASGLVAGVNAARGIKNASPMNLPRTTMIGSLCYYITHADPADFQPMKANFGIVPPLASRIKMNKRQRAQAYSERAIMELNEFLKHEISISV
ncbi:MAG: methylenetetrahydrofolate--tRNA-(uracil(54)-C(5))-methyltransferase (FADH(2)-oxidizing) TrmFO [Chloroflexota bacterium]|nr:MAG: methylenetetrahydrofolate--tRNA-(uracil(54)-C(5))-methyltransferase (FADH(2)-oxidizing) TrmFO [Chloroflexota bacterium]